jgi:hypothetical protein
MGIGRFAEPLCVPFGIDPAGALRRVARRLGIRVAAAVAEALPFKDRSLDYALMVTTICFLDDVPAAEVLECLRDAGFRRLASVQTVFRPLEEIRAPEPIEDGYGKGSFLVIRGEAREALPPES